MHIPQPFYPVEAIELENGFQMNVVGREIIFGADGLPVSIKSLGEELLASPVRLVGEEDGQAIVWDDRYPSNESEAFIHSRSDEQVLLCGSMASRRFIVNTLATVEFDGNISFDVKLMPMGKTVAQVFGLKDVKPLNYRMDRLWLEIPLKKATASLFSVFPNSPYLLSDGTIVPEKPTSNSGSISEKDMFFPFKALLWMGNEDKGLGFFAERKQNWQPAQEEKTIELVHTMDAVVLRVHLLDSHPRSWPEAESANGCDRYEPITFRFGLQATPVKPFPDKPYFHNGLHLDCFIKIKGNYWDFLSDQNRFDRLKEKGVTTLILHEKWNKEQNWFHLSEYTQNQVRKIVRECHRRGIRVLTYFGYEISSLAPIYSDYHDKVAVMEADGRKRGGWYRVPYQRDYIVCYHNEWAERFVAGAAHIMDTCHTDGVYLDGTACPQYCCNSNHGCGWTDEDGELQGTYPVLAIREMFKHLYREVHARGGIINVHAFGFQNFTALPFIDLSWYGENLQFDYCKGKFSDVPLDYFRSDYTGRNMGVPCELIAYENRPVWNFENAIAISIIHGILPRPNDIEGPLDQMSEIWKIMDGFPLEQAEWKPYWSNGAEASDNRVKISYYLYTALDRKPELLLFCANTTKETAADVKLIPKEKVAGAVWTDLLENKPVSDVVTLQPYSYKIILVK